MKLDDLFCWDCNLYDAAYGVTCLRHCPEELRATRDATIHERIRAVQRETDLQAKRGRA